MDVVKAVCTCKGRDESQPVAAFRKGMTDDWGFWTWFFTISFVLMTGGGALPVIFGWIFGKHFFSPSYRCQHCNAEISKSDMRF